MVFHFLSLVCFGGFNKNRDHGFGLASMMNGCLPWRAVTHIGKYSGN